MEKIAIKGHLTRGNDVIKILKALGGINICNLKGMNNDVFYLINNSEITCDHRFKMSNEYKYYTLEEYEQIQNNMEKRNIQINLSTAIEWYKQGGDLRKVALQAFNENELQTLPKSWKEYCKINPYLIKGEDSFFHSSGIVEVSYPSLKREAHPGVIPSKKRAEQFLILNILLQIRDCYNQGWKPDWEDGTDKYVIWTFVNELNLDVSTYVSSLFTFKSKEVRDEFFENFKEDLETIKEFL